MENLPLAIALSAWFTLTVWLYCELKDARRSITILTDDNAYLDGKCGKLNRQVNDLYAAIQGSTKP